MSSNRSPRLRARLRVCCTVHAPVGLAVTPPRCIRRVRCSMNTRTYSLQRCTASTCGEVHCDDPGGLGVQELPPVRARASRRWIDAGRMTDLPHGGGRDCHAELCEFAVDPAVSLQRILLRQADGKAGDARYYRRAPWLAPLARVVLLRRQPAVPGQQRRWRHGEDFGPAPAPYKPRQRGEPHDTAARHGFASAWLVAVTSYFGSGTTRTASVRPSRLTPGISMKSSPSFA